MGFWSHPANSNILHFCHLAIKGFQEDSKSCSLCCLMLLSCSNSVYLKRNSCYIARVVPYQNGAFSSDSKSVWLWSKMLKMNVLDEFETRLHHCNMNLRLIYKLLIGKTKHERKECLLRVTGAKTRANCALLHCTNPVSTKSHLVDKLSCKLKYTKSRHIECCHGVIAGLGRLS